MIQLEGKFILFFFLFFPFFTFFILIFYSFYRERRKKSEGRASENQQISNDEGRSASKGRERPTRSEEPIRREVITEQRGSDDRSSSSGVRSSRESSGSRSNRSDEQSNSNQIRPSSSQRVSREDVSVRPSSSQRRNDSLGESKERVVRDTVSFSRSEQPTSRQAPSPIPSQPTYNSKVKGFFFFKLFYLYF